MSRDCRQYRKQHPALKATFLFMLALVIVHPAHGQMIAPPPSKAGVTPIYVSATPVQLDPNDITRTTVGQLTYTGGVVLRSAAANFGGISGLVVDESGERFIAMSDRGTWIAGALTYDDGALNGVSSVTIATMLDWRGEPLTFANNDSEGLAWSPDKGMIVSFEGFHRIWRYSLRSLATPELLFEQTAIALGAIEGLADQPSNGGVESLAALPDGRVLAISEAARTDAGEAKAWLISDDGADTLSLRVSDDFMPTDATALDNGDVLVLERRFTLLSGAAMRLRRIPADAIRPNASMEAETLAVIQPPMTVDNMEALAAVRMEGGSYRLFIASDDNFNILQRTLLMSFVWQPAD